MEVLNVTSDEIEVRMSDADAVLINNALNEVCNGVHIADLEFHARLGATREEARALLRTISQAINVMDCGRRWPVPDEPAD
ncbi:hypothetical protein I6A60_16240 [Frankia sp. AgB1.9]|uniref:hypothetical protein n=1 Tax=unclassified Frankia TaxID=2632575 RepID=UPI00193461C4|nr:MULTISPECIES: hypothetical protein [unclassified Frankia]MBL7487982.1 hypothetical protein [Frankia sp. AgW1.1]MBL7549420.1 hypothetical protein [Frankia sp. AgB1.9]MBL7618381.1 hypothetical protein [Frankia sp. AgB1.8]